MQIESNRIPTETAHILFMDIVGFSRGALEQQARLAGDLRTVVRETAEFRRAEANSDLICLDTGDGMALVFFRDPVAPVQCAVEIAWVLRSRPELKLRMGVHSGSVSRVTDINGKENVTGPGINMAQRVMDCGDSGHILLSNRTAEDLREYESWSSCLFDLGDCEVKHGVRLHVYNLRTNKAGNPEPPARFRSAATPVAVPEGDSTTERQQVALLYRRHAQPDEYVRKLLETQLRAQGYQVFVDTRQAIGVEWAMEIERQIAGSYAVIPLLSETSLQSEMLEYEVEIAHRVARSQSAPPRILPVRVQFAGPLPESSPLTAVLTPLESAHWEGPQDDEPLVTGLLTILRNPPSSTIERARLESVGGAVPLDSRFYVVRSTDEEFTQAISRQDSIVLVKGARQMGKTSLLARGLQQARKAGAKIVLTDFQMLNSAHLANQDAFFRTLAESIADQLDLDVLPDEVWNERRGANTNLERYMRREVLGSFTEPMVWGLDEVDRLFASDFGTEVFGLFRSWHNRRSLDPEGPWSRLTLAIAYATEAHLFISDLNQSPFNVGTRLTLSDFTLEQVADLNQRHGNSLLTASGITEFYTLLGGHPYLVRRGLHDMAAHGTGLTNFLAEADRDEGLFGDHLRRILVSLSHDPDLTEVVRGLLHGIPCPTPESFYRLRSAGLLKGDTPQSARLRCPLYETYLMRHLG